MTKPLATRLEHVTMESAHIVLCDGDAILSGGDPAATFRACHHILKPGGFLFAFASPQTFHRVAAAIEDSMPLGNFEMRDAITWVHEARPVPGHDLPSRATLISLAQKAKIGTFVDNWERHEVGLIDTGSKWKGKVPSNVIDGDDSDRVTVARHLLRVFGRSGCQVLDPWMTSKDFATASSMSEAKFLGVSPTTEKAAAA